MWIGVGWTIFLGIATVVGFALDAPDLAQQVRGKKPTGITTGDIGVAVGAFATDDPDLANQGKRLANSLADSLSDPTGTASGSALPLDILAPDDVGGVLDNQEAARQRLQTLEADLLVYGRLSVAEGKTRLDLFIVLNASKMPRAEELRYTADRIAVTGDITRLATVQASLRRKIGARVDSLGALLTGVGYLGQEDYANAAQALDRSARAWPQGSSNRSLPLLLLGHAHLRTHDLDEAERAYREALEARPGYLRARFGLAEVDLQRGRGDCRRATIDERLILRARNSFAAVAAGASRARCARKGSSVPREPTSV